jgi:hydrogenase maturation protease
MPDASSTSAQTSGGTVVLGVGNPLMADDGLGIAALETLRAQWTFEPEPQLVDGGTWGMNLLPTIEQAKRLLVLDAIARDGPPGSLVRLERDELPRFLSPVFSPHQIDLKEVFALAELRGTLPVEAMALGLEPDRVEMATELSPVVQEKLGALVDAAIDQLEAWGHTASPIASATGHEGVHT